MTIKRSPKAPNLRINLISRLKALGYTKAGEAAELVDATYEAEGTYASLIAMVEEEEANAVADAEQEQLTFEETNEQPEETNVIIVTVDTAGKTTSVVNDGNTEHIVPKPLEPKAKAPSQVPVAEQMFSAAALPKQVQDSIDSLVTFGNFRGELPVVVVCGFSDRGAPQYTLLKGQHLLDAWYYLMLSQPESSEWCNMPCHVQAPTDEQLLLKWNNYRGSNVRANHITYYSLQLKSVQALSSYKPEAVSVVVASAGSSPKQTTKVAAKAKAQAPKQEPKAPVADSPVQPVFEQGLQELALMYHTATVPTLRTKLNELLTILGDTKVPTKATKVVLLEKAKAMLDKFGVAVPQPEPKSTKEKAPKAKAKSTTETKAKVPTKAEIVAWYIASDESGSTRKTLVAQLDAMNYNWKSSVDRAKAAQELGYTAA